MGVDSIITYFKRCDLPTYDMYLSTKEYVLQNACGCPLCGATPVLIQKNICGGHGEFYEPFYIRCNECRLEMLVFVPLCGSFYDGLVKTVEKWNNRRIAYEVKQ